MTCLMSAIAKSEASAQPPNSLVGLHFSSTLRPTLDTSWRETHDGAPVFDRKTEILVGACLQRARRERTRLTCTTLAALVVLGLLVLVPACARAGSFTIAWSGDPTAHGFLPKTDAGAACAYPGAAASAQAGTMPSFGACFFIFNAPGAATITSVHATGRFSKASSSDNLCAQSFADVGSPSPLNLCSAGDFDQTIPVASGRWVELGLRNKFNAPIGISTPNANNVNLASGTISLDDPSLPTVSLAGQLPAWITGDAISQTWSASDPESSIAAASYQIDGAAALGLLGDGCQDIFVCGTTRGGAFTLGGLSQLPDGAHTLTLTATSAGGAAVTSVPFATDHTPPAFVGDPTLERTTRTISWYLSDQTSGIASIALALNGTTLTPTLTATAAATWLATATIPSGLALGSATLTATIRDTAGNTATHSYTLPPDPPPPPATPGSSAAGVAMHAQQPKLTATARSACPLSASARSGRAKHHQHLARVLVLAGHLLRVDGALGCAAGANQPLTITLVNAAHPHLSRTWHATTHANGTYTAWLRPRISGAITVDYTGSATLQPANTRTRQSIRVVPIINAHFTAQRTSAGFLNPTVQGNFLPAPGATVTLTWQARIPGGTWQLIGPLTATVKPNHNGSFRQHLHLGPIDPHAQLRLIYIATPGAPYATTASPPQHLH